MLFYARQIYDMHVLYAFLTIFKIIIHQHAHKSCFAKYSLRINNIITMKKRLFQLPLLLLLLSLTTTPVRATITLSTTGKQLHSRAADFGLQFEYDLQYVALLQYVPDDMHLCHGVTEIHPGGQMDDRREKVIRVPSDEGNNSTRTDDDGEKKNKKSDDKIHIMPSHGVPVALLAKRGQCTYETKAKVASTLTSPHGLVRFVIVYDDKMEDGEHLITMMPARDEDEGRRDLYQELGLVFVSYESGMGELKNIIVTVILYYSFDDFEMVVRYDFIHLH